MTKSVLFPEIQFVEEKSIDTQTNTIHFLMISLSISSNFSRPRLAKLEKESIKVDSSGK